MNSLCDEINVKLSYKPEEQALTEIKKYFLSDILKRKHLERATYWILYPQLYDQLEINLERVF